MVNTQKPGESDVPPGFCVKLLKKEFMKAAISWTA